MGQNKKNHFFVTGTDTDIGKTYISSLIVKYFMSFGSATYLKPVQTGCSMVDSVLRAPDFDYVYQQTSCMLSENLSDHVPYCFEPACSPHLAAQMASSTIDFVAIRKSFDRLAEKAETVIVEGAGGIYAPLGNNSFVIDLIKFLKLPVLLVTSPHLGTLNHTILTIKALQNSTIPIAGVIVNNSRNTPVDFIYKDNIKLLKTFSHPYPFLEVSHGATDADQLPIFCEQLRQRNG
jgi:dethiobiotin synthetase